jgi:branched-chain amino acid transport system ATP-binding protein
MLKVADLFAHYGGIVAVRKLELDVQEGQAVALIGANGAGKSTTLKAICGLHREVRGSVVFRGAEICGLRTYKIARRGLVLVPEGRQILGSLTVLDNLVLGRLALGNRGPGATGDLDRVFALFPVLHSRRAQLGGSLSGGEQQMLAIGRALMAKPDLLVLDEPSLGLAPVIVGQMFDALQILQRGGLTILLVEQNATRALAFSNYAYILERGRVIDQGPSRDLAGKEDIIKHYLGETVMPASSHHGGSVS